MSIVAIGLNHSTAGVALRERVAFAADELSQSLQKMLRSGHAEQACLLSTCNRTEIIATSNEPADRLGKRLQDWLQQDRHVTANELLPHIYSHEESAAAEHLFRVACGLDSMVLGEPQILGQLKQAYQIAQESGAVQDELARLLETAFRVAKQVRTETDIGAHPVSVAFATVSLAKQIFSDFSTLTALFLGAGETIELACRHFHEQGLQRPIIANRTLERAQQLADTFQGAACRLENIDSQLPAADIIISSTGSQETILHYPQVKAALKQRKHKPVFMVDIAVPRDIDSKIAKLSDVYLYTVDDLQDVIQHGMQSRQKAAAEAAAIIETEVLRFQAQQRSRDAGHLIRQLRAQALLERDTALEQARKQLARDGVDSEAANAALELLAHQLTNKLLHQPTTQLSKLASEGDTESMAVASRLFGLNEN